MRRKEAGVLVSLFVATQDQVSRDLKYTTCKVAERTKDKDGGRSCFDTGSQGPSLTIIYHSFVLLGGQLFEQLGLHEQFVRQLHLLHFRSLHAHPFVNKRSINLAHPLVARPRRRSNFLSVCFSSFSWRELSTVSAAETQKKKEERKKKGKNRAVRLQ